MIFSELKQQAREINRKSNPSVFLAGLLVFLLGLVVTWITGRLLYGGFSESNFQKAMEYMQEGRYEYASSYLAQFAPKPSSQMMDAVLTFLVEIVGVGFSIFTINTVRSASPCLENLLDGFSMFLRVFLLLLLEGIFIFLWSLLLVIPGLIAAYRYRQAVYLLIDHPEMSVLDCLRKSKELMRGHKWELFSLDLSFLGWWLLSAICAPVSIYLRPFTETTRVLYYQRLAGIDNIVEPEASFF